jgi:signal transduction histidine kinase
VRGVNRLDATVAVGFVLAAVVEAVVRYHATPVMLVFNAFGALALSCLVVRRQRPLVTLCILTSAGVLGTIVPALLWPTATNTAGVWIFAMMLASYSLGVHGSGRVVVLGVLSPLVVALAADLTTMTGWARVNGIAFVTVFVGLVPTAVGRLVRARRDRLHVLREQHDQIVREQQAQAESVVLAERLRTAERLQPTLLTGLRALAQTAAMSSDPGAIETAARELLARTRHEVVSLTTPVVASPDPTVPTTDHVRALRIAAQPWVVLAAGAVAAGLFLESSRALPHSTPGWLLVVASIAVGAPLALAWYRPMPAVTLSWVGTAAFSRLVAPLDGTLSETGLVVVASFTVAALSQRRGAVAGLLLCWLGQLGGVGTGDPLGEAEFVLVCWLGGLAAGEASRLVEQTRANNAVLAGQEKAAAERAVVGERLRLARELHDAVGHSLTVAALQAGAARRLVVTDPARAREVLDTVAAAAREGVAVLESTPGTTDLAALLQHTRATGLALDADVADAALLAPPQRDVVHRIVQEALTNVLRHAPGARANVVVRRGDRGVEVVVTNSAPTGPGSGTGTERGLAGIRERVAAQSGQVTFGPCVDGGFAVRAVLPVLQCVGTEP